MYAGHIVARGRIELVDAPEPSLDDSPGGEIIFQPELACLCGSDMPYFNGGGHDYPLPVGYSLHEMVGQVVATSGTRFRPGERVLAVPLRQHGFFERFRLTDARAIPLDTRRPAEEALLAQPLGTVLFAMKKIGSVLDQDVAVVGQGPIGQMFNAVLRNLGAREIIGLDRVDARLEISRRMGATAKVHVERDDPVAAIGAVTAGQPPAIVVEAVGHHEIALDLCARICARGGRILSFGVPSHGIERVDYRALFYNNLSIVTSVDPDFTRDFPLAMRWIGEGRVDLRPLLTHRFAVSDVQQAFETFRDRRDGAQKVLLDMRRP